MRDLHRHRRGAWGALVAVGLHATLSPGQVPVRMPDWSATFYGFDAIREIAADAAGNCFLVGDDPNTGFIRTAMRGTLGGGGWSRSYDLDPADSNLYSRGHAVAVDGRGQAAVLGNSTKWNRYSLIILKYSRRGSRLWAAEYESPHAAGNGIDVVPKDIACDTNGNVYVTARCADSSYDDYYNIVILKYTAGGGLAWQTRLPSVVADKSRYGSGGNPQDTPVEVDSVRGKVYVGGAYRPNNPPNTTEYALLAQLDANSGGVIWTRTYDVPSTHYNYYSDLAIGPTGDVYAVGDDTRRYSPTGDLIWNSVYGNASVAVDGAGGAYVLSPSVSKLAAADGVREWRGTNLQFGARLALDPDGAAFAAGSRDTGTATEYGYAAWHGPDGTTLATALAPGIWRITDMTMDGRGNAFVSGPTTDGLAESYRLARYDFTGFLPYLESDTSYAGPGESIAYEAVLKSGRLAVSGASISVPLPPNTFLVSASPGYTLDGGTLTWTHTSLAAWENASHAFTVQVNDDAPDGAILETRASATHAGLGEGRFSDFVQVLVGRNDVREESLYGDRADVPITTDPVHPAIGNYVYHRELFRLPAASLPVAFSLCYNSLDHAYPGAPGYGWTHTYAAGVTFTNEPVTGHLVARVKWGDGRVETYRRGTNDEFQAVGCRSRVVFSERGGIAGWRAALPNGVHYLFDTGGRLAAIASPHAKTVSLSYASGRLSEIRDTAGRGVTLAYTNGLLASVALPFAGHAVGLRQDAASNLVAVTDLRGGVRSFLYDGSHRLLSETDPRGVMANSNRYDSAGRVVEQVDAEGRSTAFAYVTNVPSVRVRTQITGPGGRTVTHDYDEAFRVRTVADPRGRTAACAYDEDGNRTGWLDKNGNLLSIQYDASGNATSVVNALGARSVVTYTNGGRPVAVQGPLGHVSSFLYDGSNRLVGTRTAAGGRSAIAYTDPDAPYQPSQITDVRTNVWRLDYDAAGLVTNQVDPQGQAVSLTYTAMGLPATVRVPGAGAPIRLYYDAHGNVTSRVDALGREVRYAYDGNDNMVSATFVPTTGTVSYAYDAMNRVTNLVDELGGATSFRYNEAGKVASIADADGVSVTMLYDAAGNLAAQTDPGGRTTAYAYDAAGRLIAKTNELGLAWRCGYDAAGRLTEVEGPDGARRTWGYDALGRVVSVADELGRTRFAHYDAAGRLTNSIAPDGGVTSFAYDPAGNLLRRTGPMGGVWTFAYDSRGQVTNSLSPSGHGEQREYDARGNLARLTARDGRVYAYTYDAGDRLTSVALPGGAGTVSNLYDAAGRLAGVAHGGRVSSRTYDRAGRLLSFTDANGNAIAYTYTPGGRVATVTCPGGRTVTNGYDGVGRLALVRDWAGHAITFAYDALNRVRQVTYPNGATKTFAYDASHRVTEVSDRKPDATVIHSSTFGYDAAGQATGRTERAAGTLGALSPSARTAAYDAADRLLTVFDGSATNRYWYDASGHLQSNETAAGVARFAYDAMDRLTVWSNGARSIRYDYGPNGLMTGRRVDGVETRYLRDGRTTYCRLDAANRVQEYYIHAGPLVYSLTTNGNLRVYHGDERGSVVAITDGGAAVLQSYAYAPYGRTIGASGTLTNEFQFAGGHGVLREESGLYQMGARFYDPDTGRFISPDPLGLAAGPNLYPYADGDPVNRMDPAGLQTGTATAFGGESFFYGGYKSVIRPRAEPYLQHFSSPSRDYFYVAESVPGRVFPKFFRPVSGPMIRSYVRAVTPGKEIAVYEGPPKAMAVYEKPVTAMAEYEKPTTAIAVYEPPVKPSPAAPQSYWRSLYNGIRKDARVWWAAVSAEAYGYYLLGQMPVSAILSQGGAVLICEVGALLVVEGVVVGVVTYEINEYTGFNDTVESDMALALSTIFYTPDNLIDMNTYNEIVWREIERLNQKVQTIDGLVEEIQSMPMYDAVMSLQDPYQQ